MERANFYDVPEEVNTQRFTTLDIANITNETTYAVGNARMFLGIQGKVESTKSGRTCFFTYSEMKQIKDLLEARKARQIKKPEQEEEKHLSIAELKKQHPLVTDERCFNLHWWPNIMPICFEDIGV